MRILIACGGSGGHIFPGIALAQELAKRNNKDDILIACSRKPLDKEILEKSGFNFEAMDYIPFILSFNPFKIIFSFIKLSIGIFLGVRLLLRFRPDCVAGFGGFVSGPIIFAAWFLRIPCLIHEQNFIAGAANKIASFFVKKIAVSFEDTKRFFNKRKAVMVGNPVRINFLNLDKYHSRERFGLEEDRFTIFITGGSQGAVSLNNVVADALILMDYEKKKRLQIIHLAGERDCEILRERYSKENIKTKVFSFLDEIDRAYTAADLVITRAGATTISELTYFGKPAILVPYPKKSVHQIENARFISDNKAGVTIEEKDLSTRRMKEEIISFMDDAGKLKGMSDNSKRLGNPDAGRLLAEEVLRIC